MKPRKVFCIGFHKTGTSSLGVALERLGYDVAGFYPFRKLSRKDSLTLQEVEDVALGVAAKVDAAQDSPWPILYQQLDKAFPNSRFIHVTRNREAWIKSAVNDFGTFPNAMRRLIYGTDFPHGNEAAWLARYDQHNADVCDYFAGRPDDFISLDLDQSQVNWGNVCTFLGEPVPDISWPYSNRRQTKKFKMKYYKVLSKLGLKKRG